MSLRTTFSVLALLALSTLASAAVTPPANSALSAPAAAAFPAWLQPAKGAAKYGKDPLAAVFRSNCATDCYQVARACYAACDGDVPCEDACGYDFTCCNQACNPLGPQCD